MRIIRNIKKTIDYALKQTKVVLVTGPRQSGKSFIMLNHYDKYEYITFDDNNELLQADNDPILFLQDKEYPLIIDEAQYAQNLFRTIKLVVDKSSKKGQVLLTGSQSFKLMEKISDSLAGRISIIEMSNVSMREINKLDYNEPFIPNEKYLKNRSKALINYKDIWEYIQKGFFPEIISDKNRNIEWFYRDYVNTYLEKDIKQIIKIKDDIAFRKFLVNIAARTGQEIVYEEISSNVGKDVKTIKEWLSIVSQTGLVKLIYPYQNNVLKQMVKLPKLYFMDTGLVCYLVGWKTKEQTKNGAMAGALFETFVYSEIIKSFLNAGQELNNIYYYRDKQKNEIDMIIDDNDTLYPIEIKMAATVDTHWTNYNKILSKIKNKKIANITILCQCDKLYKFDSMDALPISYI